MADATDLVMGMLGAGPATEMALVGRLMGHGWQYESATHAVKGAIVHLHRAGKIEFLQGTSIYRLAPGSAQMEGDK